MRSTFRATAIALLLTAVAGIARAQTSTSTAPTTIRIAYVNTQALMEAAPGRVAAESLLNKEGAGYQAQLQIMQDSINKMLSAYQKAEPTLTATQKTQRQGAMQSLETDFQAKQLQFQKAFQDRTAEVMAPVQDVVRKVLDDIRVEDGYAMILDHTPGQTPIISADKNLDITDRVISRLRATTKPALPAAKTGAPTAPAGVTRPPRPPAE